MPSLHTTARVAPACYKGKPRRSDKDPAQPETNKLYQQHFPRKQTDGPEDPSLPFLQVFCLSEYSLWSIYFSTGGSIKDRNFKINLIIG